MTKEELSKEIQAELKNLEEHSKQLAATVEVLRRTASSGDFNVVALKDCKALLDGLPDVSVKSSVQKIRKALATRGKALIKELES